ncbi:MAG: hypothetical protein CMJ48_09965 [Planctomycetaceae bacterium]|nr:hypothetical protein [Planctomycetaceae bacterium]
MDVINHPLLGRLEHEAGEGWHGWIRLERFTEYGSHGSGVADEDAPADAEFRALDHQFAERTRMFGEGRFPIVIGDCGAGALSAAQERSIEFLVANESGVLEALVRHLYEEYQLQCEGLREYHGQSDDGTLDDVVPVLDSPEGLKRLISFGEFFVGVQAIEGHVPISLYGGCTWDEEHGLELDFVKDRVLGWDDGVNPISGEGTTPFACPLPEGIDVSAIRPDAQGCREVELRIHGRWSGIYAIDEENRCTGLARPCPFCLDGVWDPEGIDAVREVPRRHRVFASPLVFAMIHMLPSLGLMVVSPLLLLLGALLWPGLFWGSLAICSGAMGALLLVFRRHIAMRRHPVFWVGLVQFGLAAAGLVAWYRFDAFAGGSITDMLGWLVWSGSALIAGAALVFGLYMLLDLAREMGVSAGLFSLPFVAFAAIVGTALWFAGTGVFSPFHLLWIVPGTVFVVASLGAGGALAGLRWMGRGLESDSEEGG